MRINKIDDLVDMWMEDSKIPEMDLDKSSLDAAKLHGKYMSILVHHKLLVKKIGSEYKKVKLVKWKYYRGELNNPADLQKYNLPPMQNTIMKQDIDIWLDADDELCGILLKKEYHEEIVDACKEIIKQLGNRQWQIRNAIEHRKFISGG